MPPKLEEILSQIKMLEYELLDELKKKEAALMYEVYEKRVLFQDEVRRQHRLMMIKIRHYLRDANVRNILTAPVIYACLLPALLMDVMLSLYQAVCFPVYGIPKVRRRDYIIIDRQYLSYLNAIEKINCMYCGYFNGLVAYVREIVARTEQYWCPIKHAHKIRSMHSRYKYFFEYGDAVHYRAELETLRRSFDDLKNKKYDPAEKA
jgi:hypothetical protein